MSKKVYSGVVTSSKMNKTIVVTVETVKSHPMYGKKIKSIKKYMVHAEKPVSEGEIVSFQESKPFSKRVKFELVTLAKDGN
jgi:small subunit ribosomal protein S17